MGHGHGPEKSAASVSGLGIQKPDSKTSSAIKPMNQAWPLCPGLARNQARPGGVHTYLGLRVSVDPLCLSLAVLWGTGPAPAFRSVTGIRTVR